MIIFSLEEDIKVNTSGIMNRIKYCTAVRVSFPEAALKATASEVEGKGLVTVIDYFCLMEIFAFKGAGIGVAEYQSGGKCEALNKAQKMSKAAALQNAFAKVRLENSKKEV